MGRGNPIQRVLKRLKKVGNALYSFHPETPGVTLLCNVTQATKFSTASDPALHPTPKEIVSNPKIDT
jgi:hypothetical protein